MKQTEQISSTTDKDSIFAQLVDSLGVVMGHDVVALMHVTPSTRIFLDLGLTSIDVVQVANEVTKRYPRASTLAVWVSDRPMRDIARLTIADIVEYIANADH